MRTKLTIGELAKLFNISTHTIRHYEEKKLFQPSSISDGGYRLYDEESVFYLGVILNLRKSDIPIKNIQTLIADYSKENYLEAMHISKQKIEEQIFELEQKKNEIDAIINFSENINKYIIKFEPQRTFSCVKQFFEEIDFPIKELYDLYQKYNINSSTLYKDNIHFTVEGENLTYIVPKSIHGLKQMSYPQGTYLTYHFLTNSEDDVDIEIANLFKYLKSQKLAYTGNLLLIHKQQSAIINGNDFSFEIQIKISSPIKGKLI